ncbi:MAG: cysteine desulfurase [Chlamydiales bacterium]|nr:cysteine desulfurase [Chlamydiia bacterium]MCP5507801.1 cysteine desulfurase [Chlamydiales bacterium]
MKGIYLDNSMTTRPSERTISAMMPYLTEKWGTPSAPHKIGNAVIPAIEESLRAIYALLQASDDDDVIFTSSGAEAVNQVLQAAYFDVTMATGQNHFITSQIDEAPAIMGIGRLEQLGCNGTLVKPSPTGVLTAEAIADAITPRTALVSLSWANGLTGTVNPIHEIAQVCRERGIRFHIDATHALGRLYFDREDLGADFITFNGDNLHAPKGTGALWIRSGARCSPFIIGGIEQAGHRAGSYSIAALAALGEAAKEAVEAQDLLGTEVARLRDSLEEQVLAQLPQTTIFFRDQERLPNITAMGFPKIANEAMLFTLNQEGLYGCIGGGSFQQIGIVIHACGIPESDAHTAVSFALSRETSQSDIDKAAAIIVNAAKQLQSLSQE